jgi:sugar phosphate isomerase/epimerase
MTRRESLKNLAALAALGMTSGKVFGNDDKAHGLILGVASYSLNKLTPDQVIAALADLDIHYVSLFKTHCPWGGKEEECRAAGKKFRDAGLTITGSGVIDLPNDEVAVRKAFTNAKAAGLPTMVCTPALEAFPMVDKFVKEFDIKLAIHNHGPENKTYPGPAEAWKAAEPFDKRIGLCIDVGHSFRAGQDPAAAIRKYRERLYHIHLKDLTLENGKEVPCVVGQGNMDVKGIIAALKEVGYSDSVDFEYEKSGGDHVEGLRESIAFVRPLAA